ncbi:MAG: amidohydrolase [Alphaproteobacteria bacterium]|nr:amidohydrolase [Alphaproteobacteria bacterium]
MGDGLPIIDFSSRPPTPGFAVTGAHLDNYRRVYAASERAAGDERQATQSVESYLAMYQALNARHIVIKARDVETTFGFRVRNEDAAEFCRQHPKFIGFAGVDPHKGMTALRELEHAVKELGLRGLNLQCFEHKLRINDPKMYPLYAKCIELDIPVNIHCSVNFSADTSMDYGKPAFLDEVMVHFPELRVCAAPPGWPWVHELVAVAWRHPNVWISLAPVRPKYLAVANSGYEGLLTYGDTVLQDRIIFGTSYPLLPVERSIAEIEALPIKDASKRKWLHDNAARFLRVE